MLALHQLIATGKSRRAMLGLLDLLLDVNEGGCLERLAGGTSEGHRRFSAREAGRGMR
ncbi:MAG: hypothetical protein KGQ87_09275 [Verrucomicrobia bacterium]|nr:hypothetical protein [Verrucomicrobiota bacterium]